MACTGNDGCSLKPCDPPNRKPHLYPPTRFTPTLEQYPTLHRNTETIQTTLASPSTEEGAQEPQLARQMETSRRIAILS